MPIDIQFQPDAAIIAQAAASGAGGVAAQQAYLQQTQIDQGNVDRNLRLQMALLQAHLQQQQMGQQNSQFYAGLGAHQASDIYGQNLRYDLGQQEIGVRQDAIDQQAQSSENQLQGQMAGQMAQVARQRQAQNMQLFMADRKAILDARLPPRQFAQAKQKLEAHYGMQWGFPEEALQQQEGQAQQMERTRIQQAITSHDGTQLLPDAFIDDALQMDPEKRWGIIGKAQAEHRQRLALEQKAGSEDAKTATLWDERDIKAATAMDKRAHDDAQKAADQRHADAMKEIERKAAKAKAFRDAHVDFQRDTREWAKGAKDADMKDSMGPKPEWKDYDPSAAFADEPGGGQASALIIPANTTPEEVSRIVRLQPENSLVTLPNGHTFKKKADGSLELVQ